MSRYSPDHEPDSERQEDAHSAPAGENGFAEAAAALPRTLPEATARIAALLAELEAKNADLAEANDRHLRDRAEFENFKRRMQRDKSEALRFANEPLLRELLPVLDNLERAVRAAHQAEGSGARSGSKADTALDSLVTGVEMVLKQFSEVLGRHGVARVDTVERAFDPAEHEALAQIESHHHPAGTVLEEHTAGYRLHDRLLRAAQVTVAKTPSRGS